MAGGLLSSTYADTIQQAAEAYRASLPPSYRMTNTDTQWDKDYPYVVLQRLQLHVIYYMVMLSPLKGHLTMNLPSGSSSHRSKTRAEAVSISLNLMDASHQLFDYIFPATAKFHSAAFFIFDTASILCSAIIHDSTGSLPQRDSVIKYIGLALGMMKQLGRYSKSGAISFTVLQRLATTPSYILRRATVPSCNNI